MQATIKKGERIFLLLCIYVGCLCCAPAPPHCCHHIPQSVLHRWAQKSASSEPCPLSLTAKIHQVCELILQAYIMCSSPTLTPHNALLLPCIYGFHSFCFAPDICSLFTSLQPKKTPIMSNWLYFQIKLGCEGAGECCPGDWLSPGCCPAVPHPCLKRSSPFPALPFTFCVHCKGTKPRRGMGQVLLPQPGIPSLAPAGLHPTAGSS